MMRLMIVEDNTQMRRLIKSVVGDFADTICECADGAEAVAAYIKHQPDFVLMDISMKAVDGLTATAQIMTVDPTAKVIIVTSHDGARLRQAANEAGARGFVLKENLFSLRDVMQAMSEIFV